MAAAPCARAALALALARGCLAMMMLQERPGCSSSTAAAGGGLLDDGEVLVQTLQAPGTLTGDERHRSPELDCVENIKFDLGGHDAFSNLGGWGPDIKKPPELRFRHVGNVHDTGEPFDIVITNTSYYLPNNYERNGVGGGMKYAQVNLRTGQSVDLKLGFYKTETNTPVTLGHAELTFCDVDKSNDKKKEIYSIDVDAFFMVPDGPEFKYAFTDLAGNAIDGQVKEEEVQTMMPGGLAKKVSWTGGKFRVTVTADKFGAGCDNPSDFNDLSTITSCPHSYSDPVDQVKRCFGVQVKDTSSMDLKFSATGGTNSIGGRNLVLAGASMYFQDIEPCPTMAPTPAPATVTGDPHVTTVDGRRFNLVRPGAHELVRLPRAGGGAAAAEEPLLVAVARVEPALGRACEDPYVREVELRGRWLNRTGPLRFRADGDSPSGEGAVTLQVNGSAVGHVQLPELVARSADMSAQVDDSVQGGSARTGSIARSTFLQVTLHIRGATLKVQWVHRAVPGLRVNHLNFGMSGLGKLGMDVGGILGLDDHSAAATPPAQCASSTDLRSTGWRPVGEALSAVLGEESGPY